MADNLQTSSSTAVAIGNPGISGGGPSYASYGSWVRSVYQRSWVVPKNTASADATVKVSVRIARDGTVISSQIIERSGDAEMDASVQRTLERVTSVGRPFPEGATDQERAYIIPFSLRQGTA
jgi:TonB family protein